MKAKLFYPSVRVRRPSQTRTARVMLPLLLLCLALTLASSTALAHGIGYYQIRGAQIGPYAVHVWVAPGMLRTGDVHIDTAVFDAAGKPALARSTPCRSPGRQSGNGTCRPCTSPRRSTFSCPRPCPYTACPAPHSLPRPGQPPKRPRAPRPGSCPRRAARRRGEFPHPKPAPLHRIESGPFRLRSAFRTPMIQAPLVDSDDGSDSRQPALVGH